MGSGMDGGKGSDGNSAIGSAMKLKIPPPVQALVIAALMWWLNALIPSGQMMIPGVEFLVGLWLAAGAVLDLSALFSFHRAKTTVNPLKPANASALVISGIYRYTRNPMYLGLCCLLTAWLLWLGNVYNLALLVLFPLYITWFQIRPEEEVLARLFGDEYADYCRKVRRWV